MSSSYILAVMGVTGAGKSSFVKLVTGDATVKVGETLGAESKEIKSYETIIRGRRFTLVDTPGFDDDSLTDSEVLKMLVDWLVSSYRSNQKLNGILYLHRIVDARVRASSMRNWKMFRQLIGEDFHKNLTLGTTCWSLVPFHVGFGRETELKNKSDYWKMMISKGARIERISDDRTQAQNLVYEIASHNALALQTQRDVVERGVGFRDLTVTKTVNYELDKLRREQAAEVQRIREETQREMERKERAWQEQFAAENERFERVMYHLRRRERCDRTKPYGTCDNIFCSNQVKRWTVIWHCCSCSMFDNYWHCAPCGSDCGNEEHPVMTRIDNSGDCTVM